MNRKPNLILCLIDDLGWMDLSCCGSTFYETPAIDRLASRGTRFSQAYAPSPLCLPTRGSIMTGQYPARCRMTGLNGEDWGRLTRTETSRNLPPDTVTVADALRDGGYRTWHVGKWHCGDDDHPPQRHGFEVNVGGGTIGRPADGYFSPWHLPALEDAEEGTHLTDHLTDRAIALIDEAGDDPWFLNLWHYSVHDPIEAKPKNVERFRRKASTIGLDRIDPFVDGEMHPRGDRAGRRLRRRIVQSDPVYAAMLFELDENIGRLWSAVESRGLAHDTILVFASDNGGLHCGTTSPPTSNLPLGEGKGWAQDGGVRVPAFVLAPGRVPAGRVDHRMIALCDIYPTLVEAAGLPARPAQHRDAISFWPLFANPELAGRNEVFFHHPHYSPQGDTPHGAIRRGEWKLVERFEDGARSLFHLPSDPAEQFDRAVTDPALCAELHQALRRWRGDVHAIVPGPNENWPDPPRD